MNDAKKFLTPEELEQLNRIQFMKEHLGHKLEQCVIDGNFEGWNLCREESVNLDAEFKDFKQKIAAKYGLPDNGLSVNGVTGEINIDTSRSRLMELLGEL